MPSKAIEYVKMQRLVGVVEIDRMVFEMSESVNTSGATDEHLSFILRIDVYHGFTCEEAWLHSECPIHSCLLRNREHTFYLAHRQVTIQKS